ncbi:MAG: apolipoprotein N-acyltransferase [Magnetococcales bacterium]|nr:apolipoprotein N-acyltransferase [Magnetococcales bacterium]
MLPMVGAAVGQGMLDWPLVSLLALVVLLHMLHGVAPARGARRGFLFGLGCHGLGLMWLLPALQITGGLSFPFDIMVWLLPVLLLAASSALFGAGLAWLTPTPWLLPVTAPALWVVIEWLWADLFDWGWVRIGILWSGENGLILQNADWGGIHALSWLAIFLPAIGAAMVAPGLRTRPGVVVVGGLVVMGTVIAAVEYGSWRLEQAQVWLKDRAPLITIGLVQTHVPKEAQNRPRREGEADLVGRMRLMETLEERVDLVLWPERSLPDPVVEGRENPQLERLAQLSQAMETPLLLGLRHVLPGSGDNAPVSHQSLILLDPLPAAGGGYRKHRLLPFGDYDPLGANSPVPGPPPRPLQWAGPAMGPILGLEIVDEDQSRRLTLAGARWLVNAADERPFGAGLAETTLALARIRAVENRLALARVTDNGRSAVLDPWGRVVGAIPGGVSAALATAVPAGPADAPFRRLGGGVWPWLCLLVLTLVGLAITNGTGSSFR